MLNKPEFNRIREEMHKLDLRREELIQLSREIITISKQIIYAAQRNDMGAADSAIKDIKNKVSKLKKIKIHTDTNIISVAFSPVVEYFANLLEADENSCPKLIAEGGKFTGEVELNAAQAV